LKNAENFVDISGTAHIIASVVMTAGVHSSDADAFRKLATSEGVNIYSRRDGGTDLEFLARDAVPPYVDNRPMLVAGKPELREYKAVFVGGDKEVSQFSDETTVNCAPLV
jgi:hypothetical protein